MTRLLTILSWTLLLNACNSTNSPIMESWYTLWWYYVIGTYDIHICMFGDWNQDPTIAHELWHLFWFIYLWKEWTKKQYEWFAEAFSSCRMDLKCRPFLIKLVTDTVNKKKPIN